MDMITFFQSKETRAAQLAIQTAKEGIRESELGSVLYYAYHYNHAKLQERYAITRLLLLDGIDESIDYYMDYLDMAYHWREDAEYWETQLEELYTRGIQ